MIEITPEHFGLLLECAREHPMRINDCEELFYIRDAMRAQCPKEGTDIERWMTVYLPGEQGNHLETHAHDEHTVLFYPADSDMPLIVERDASVERIYPKAGMVQYLPPGTRHRVGRVHSPRLSVAMLVKV